MCKFLNAIFLSQPGKSEINVHIVLCSKLILTLHLPIQIKSNPRLLSLHCDVTTSIFVSLDSYTDCSLYPSLSYKTMGSSFATEICKTNCRYSQHTYL